MGQAVESAVVERMVAIRRETESSEGCRPGGS